MPSTTPMSSRSQAVRVRTYLASSQLIRAAKKKSVVLVISRWPAISTTADVDTVRAAMRRARRDAPISAAMRITNTTDKVVAMVAGKRNAQREPGEIASPSTASSGVRGG